MVLKFSQGMPFAYFQERLLLLSGSVDEVLDPQGITKVFCFNMFYFHSWGNDPILTCAYFFKWVGSTTNQKYQLLTMDFIAVVGLELTIDCNLEKIGKYIFFGQLLLVLGVKLMGISSNLFSRKLKNATCQLTVILYEGPWDTSCHMMQRPTFCCRHAVRISLATL